MFRYEDIYNGEMYKGSFRRGKPDEPFTYVEKSDGRGLYVRFMPDSEIFEETVFDYDTLLNRMREQAFLNPGIRIIMRDERDLPQNNGKVREDILHYEGGIVSFVEYLNRNKHCNVINPDIIYMKARRSSGSPRLRSSTPTSTTRRSCRLRTT